MSGLRKLKLVEANDGSYGGRVLAAFDFMEAQNTATAEFSPFRRWRYTLRRRWSEGPEVAFLMFNPSTADEMQDDPTIRKCRGFAQRWRFGSMVIVNLFAVRGSDPRIVARDADPVGPDNDRLIVEAVKNCCEVVCAWGCGGHMKGRLRERPAVVINLLRKSSLQVLCLGYTADGSPRHPLMLPYSTPLQLFQLQK